MYHPHVGLRGGWGTLVTNHTKYNMENSNPLIQTALVKEFIRGKWSDFWATQINNKLHSVQPTLGCGSLSNRDRRREQLVLCRLRLGHTYTTHRYLLAGEDPPVCISCQENLTVEHILIHCAEYFHVRIQCFDVDNLQELFNTVSPDTILRFIQRARPFYLI